MVHLITISRILLEGFGEFMIISSALLFTLNLTNSVILFIYIISLLIIGVGLRILGDEIYTSIKSGILLGRIFHFEK